MNELWGSGGGRGVAPVLMREWMCLQPKGTGYRAWINADVSPPSGLVTEAVDLAMVPATQRDGELIADLARQRAPLGKAQVMRFARRPATDRARLLGDEPDVLTIAHAPRLGEGKHGLVDDGLTVILMGAAAPLPR